MFGGPSVDIVRARDQGEIECAVTIAVEQAAKIDMVGDADRLAGDLMSAIRPSQFGSLGDEDLAVGERGIAF